MLEKARAIIGKALAEGVQSDGNEGKELLALYGVPTPRGDRHLGAAGRSDRPEIGFPAVMKIVSPDILHKTEAGGVRLGVKDSREAQAVYDEIQQSARAYNPNAKLDGVLIEENIADAEQLIVGFKQDRLLARPSPSEWVAYMWSCFVMSLFA